jgi:hypothetical protein
MSKIGKNAGAILVLVIVIAIATLALVIYKKEVPSATPPEPDLTLSNYPELFKKDVIIVEGENATQIEMEGTQAIANNLSNLTGNMPVIKKDVEITENEKSSYNLILVGTPLSNKLLRDVYERNKATRVTAGYPGIGKGMLEILKNPWNEDKAMLLVAGSDELGIRAGENELRWMELSKTNLRGTSGDIKAFIGTLRSLDKSKVENISCIVNISSFYPSLYLKAAGMRQFYIETDSENRYYLTNINPCSALLPGEELVTKKVIVSESIEKLRLPIDKKVEIEGKILKAGSYSEVVVSKLRAIK